MVFEEWLKEQRERVGLSSQRALRKALLKQGVEVSKSTLSHWHKGHHRPRVRHLVALLDVLAVYDPRERERVLQMVFGGAE
jgi:transcriptional regulator with XRE-family HTH domain